MLEENTIIVLKPQGLSLLEVVQVARKGAKVVLSEELKEKINQSRQLVEKMIEQKRVVYGITTGFGKFATVTIGPEDTRALQHNLIVSHAVGVGKPLPEETVRAMMLLRAYSLSRGYSGIRLTTIQALLDALNAGIHPVVPEKGSLGSSGDLAPLSHMILPLLGLGEAFYKGKRISGQEALQAVGLKPIVLEAKEGLALNNGTQCMTAVAALVIADGEKLVHAADIIAALTMEALNGMPSAFDPRIHQIRNHPGQIETATTMLNLLEGSEYTAPKDHPRVQDAYALRCIAQVHGPIKEALAYAKQVVEREINGVTDNPLIFLDTEEAISGGNFHGEPIALALDFLGIAFSELANIAERRLERLVNPALSNGLPAFLTTRGGVNSGFMIVQYSAAALVSENKILAHPASVDSIPSSANQEDHVSMGTIAARKAAQIVDHATHVLAMELLAACQGIDLRGPKRLGKGTEPTYRKLRDRVAMLEEDRVMYPDIDAAVVLIREGL
jgi:histidine ammonia-lyase